MRKLSPREIRLTSPRELTPRMAARVAATQLTGANLAVPNSRSLPTSPLAAYKAEPKPLAPPLPPRKPSAVAPVSFDKSGPVFALEDDEESTAESYERPSWPAVPFRSPSSPKIDEFFRPQNAAAGVSAETLRRMQASPPTAPSGGWKPARPPRPDSPDLSEFAHTRTLSHTLSPELVDHIRSPGGPAAVTAESPMSPELEVKTGKEGKPRLRGRAASVSIKGLRHHMSGKNLNLTWGEKDKKEDIPALPVLALPPSTPGKERETVGLFKGATDHQHTSSFASLREGTSPASVNEFGQSQSPFHPAPSHPSEPQRPHADRPNLASRFFSFGKRGSTRDQKDLSVQVAQRSVSAPKASTISGPIASSFQRLDGTVRHSSESSSHVTSPTAGIAMASANEGLTGVSPQSPASPRSVRRKPVPGLEGVNGDSAGGMRGSESLSSMRSFVLQDPPKTRPKNLA